MAFDLGAFEKKYGIKAAPAVDKRYSVGKTPTPKTGPGAFFGNVASSAAKIGGSVLGAVGKEVGSIIGNVHDDVARNASFNARAANANRQLQLNDIARQRFHKDYASGKISKARFTKLMKDISESEQAASKDLQDVTSVGKFVGDYAKLAGLGLTVASAGTTAAPTAFGVKAGGTLAKANSALASSVGAGKVLAGKSSLAIPGKLARNALVTQPTIKAATEIPGQLKRGDNTGAAINAAILAAPAGISVAAKNLPKVGAKLNTAFYGKNAGPIKSFFGSDKVDAATKNNPLLQKTLKQAEEFTKSQPAVKNGKQADEWFNDYLVNTLKLDPKKLTVEEFADRFRQYARPLERLDKLKAAGKVDKRTVLTANYGEKVRNELKRSGANFDNVSGQERADLVKQLAEKVAGQNPTAKESIGDILWKAKNLDDALEQIKLLDRLPGTKIPGFKPPKGFRVSPAGPKQQAVLTPLKKVSGDLDSSEKAAPILGSIGKMLEKFGVSTQSQNTAVYGKFRGYLDNELQGAGVDAKSVITKLSDYIHKTSGVGVFDERQLGVYTLKKALGVNTAEAKAVKKAILRSYDRMTLGDLSLAGKVENALYRVPGYGQYRRIQGALRYQLNPFFRLQSAVEAELLAQNVAKGKKYDGIGLNNIRQLFNSKSADELDNISKKLAGKFGEGFAGEGAADSSYGLLSAKLTRSQKNSVAGLVKTMAERSGKSVDDFIESASPEVINNIRSIVQYPTKGFTSSNFAKTLNLVAFPARYNVKLAGIAGKALADMPPMMQIGTLKAISDYNTFLNSDEGIKWQSDNSEILGMIGYLNPLNNINKILRGLQTGDLAISDFGLIGGLPLGVLTQMLKSQTGISTNPAYLNPKTGELVPDKIAASDAGAIKLAIVDMINSMYSWPGRTFGVPLSKQEITTGFGRVIPFDKGDTKNKDQQLSPHQKRVQGILKSPEKKTQSSLPPIKRSEPLKLTPPPYTAGSPVKKVRKAKVKTKAVRPGRL